MLSLRLIMCLGLGLLLCPPVWAEDNPLELGAKPPSFLGRDLRRNDISLDELQGKIVLISFWSSRCDPCLDDMPTLEHIQVQVPPEELVVVAVNVRDPNASTVRNSLINNTTLEATYTFDRRNLIANTFDITQLPTLVLIDRQGHVAYVMRGEAEDRLERVAEELNRLLARE